MIRVVDGETLIDRTIVLGCREAMAGVEYALMGMQVGGYRKGACQSSSGLPRSRHPDLIPPNAVLICKIWLRDIAELRPSLVRRYQVSHESSCPGTLPCSPKLRLDAGAG